MPEFSTAQVHAGEARDAAHGARVTPIYLTAGFEFDSFAQAGDRFVGEEGGYTYSRSGNPTTAALERRVAALEGGREAIAVGSGQAALTVAVLGLVKAGDHILSAQGVYSGTRGLFETGLQRLGIDIEFVDDPTDVGEWRRRLRPNTRLLFGESIANPSNDILDIEAVAAVAHGHGIPLVIDNTLATPYLVRPVSGQMALPTNGYRAPTDAEQFLEGQSYKGVSGPQARPAAPTPGVVTGAAAAAPGFKL